MKNYDIFIGIDPDVDKSGVAFFDKKNMTLSVGSYIFPESVDIISKTYESGCILGERILVVAEASWKVKSNWHLGRGDTRAKSSSKGYDVGRNHETGRKLIECLLWQNDGLEVVEQTPLRKCWLGKDGKITHKELVALCEMSGIYFDAKRTNQEERDASLLAVVSSGVPIKFKSKL